MATTARKPTNKASAKGSAVKPAAKASPIKKAAGSALVHTSKASPTKKAAGSALVRVKSKGLEGLFGILTDAEADQAAARVSKLRGYDILKK